MLENNILKKNILKNFKTSDKNAVYAIGSKVNLNDRSLEYNKLVDDLLNNDIVLKMKNYIQHGNTTCYQHCNIKHLYSVDNK